ncbi:virion structural protein [Synechococcus phage ACG-2014d]|jgi:hypothetical protein|uniref:Virion structural protein n=1 Tax=Synechococcus phage ACG-2014d TaxID=1493509 RepID=A0A0E3F952_9CAUD|nr:virion structural protein [Synechococcus phage ACG-2014d]YP_010355246.1 virion structural protein [Synechococcus phage ACG-2014d]AIX14688.1 virion structural protein [Synechococcus phage ACG-2014d]AIX14907.1 virion structural protein [Synechococcus phage ACG-2014d]AIX15334.1 virion structural protein [Synechococcus phage ACG-2014d]AIX15552.1 virion structural protein [Synechococcus phage ACG-2014d]AIX15981.1 virion structural protein [Synechococcus phage ACG-2014d]
MPQNTNLNVTPYYDDFDKDKNFYKVLFRPGFPIQARELTTMQSIMQNQIEGMGTHFFKEGAMVIPGQIGYDLQVNAILLQQNFLGADIESYREQLTGKTITGVTTGIKAKVLYSVSSNESDRGYVTLYVKYIDSADSTSETTVKTFKDNEQLIADADITFGTTLIEAASPFAQMLPSSASAVASAAYINEGVYFIRGYFVDVPSSYIILDQYSNTPSYRVGLSISESIITSEDDPTLNDNAAGTSNYSAPGAHRFRIRTTLVKKAIDDDSDKNFVELLRLVNSKVQQFVERTEYSELEKSLALRTFEESGDYALDSFDLAFREHKNDGFNEGVYDSGETSPAGQIASDEFMACEVSPGKAYVRGYRVENLSPTFIDIPKSRSTKSIQNTIIPFELRQSVLVTNIWGWPNLTGPNLSYNYQVLEIRDDWNPAAANDQPDGNIIGFCRTVQLSNDTTNGGIANTQEGNMLFFMDADMYVVLNLNTDVSSSLQEGDLLVGATSSARGFVREINGTTVKLLGTKGSFQNGETVNLDGIALTTLDSSWRFDFTDARSFLGRTDPTNLSSTVVFTADLLLNTTEDVSGKTFTVDLTTNGGADAAITGFASNFAAEIRPGDVLSVGISTETGTNTFRVDSVDQTDINTSSSNQNSGTDIIFGTPTEQSVTLDASKLIGTVADGTYSKITRLRPRVFLKDYQNGNLTIDMPKESIKSISDESFTAYRTYTAQTIVNGGVTITLSENEQFEVFDNDNFVLIIENQGSSGTYTTGELVDLEAAVASSAIAISFGADRQTCTLSSPGGSGTGLYGVSSIKVNVAFSKNVVQRKVKTASKMQILEVTKTANNTDAPLYGLAYSRLYGTRIEDDEISLGLNDVYTVHAVYESNDDAAAKVPFVTLVESAFFATGTLIEGTTSGARARVVDFTSTNLKLYHVILDGTFIPGELVTGVDSNDDAISAFISDAEGSIELGSTDITEQYILDPGQDSYYYDISRLSRGSAYSPPRRRLKVVFDFFVHEASGDYFNAQSYVGVGYKDIPTWKPDGGIMFLRDTLDFRPGVKELANGSGTVGSPYYVNCTSLDFPSRVYDANSTVFDIMDEGTLFRCDFDYYLPRIDKLFLTHDGDFQLIQGKPDEDPQEPDNMDAAMFLATIEHKPYGYDPERDVLFQTENNKRYTMRDIGNIEERLTNVEYYTSLSLLESEAQNATTYDEDGLNRFKNGYIVDDFTDHTVGDVLNADYNASLDFENGYLRPSHYTNNVSLEFDPLSSQGVQWSGPDPEDFEEALLVTLPYQEITQIEQPYASRVENVNPFNVFTFIGRIDMLPSSDDWIDIKRLPARVENVEGDFSSVARDLNVDKNGFAPIQWGAWKTNWTGRTLTGRSSYRSSTNIGGGRRLGRLGHAGRRQGLFYLHERRTFRVVNNQGRRGVRTRVVPKIERKSQGDTILSQTAIPWIRSRNLRYTISRAKPKTRLYGFFDKKKITNYCTPKLIELVKNSSEDSRTNETPFVPGEIVKGLTSDCRLRCLKPNSVYDTNPYTADNDALPSSYSSQTNVLNNNSAQLASIKRPNIRGNMQVGEVLLGLSSGARAVVKDRRIITDKRGFVRGCFFIPKPVKNVNPRWRTGTRLIRFSSSEENSTVPGTVDSSAETEFTAKGTLQTVRENILAVRNAQIVKDTVTDSRTVTSTRTEVRQVGWYDPLAQSFIVDTTGGVFLTSVDVFFNTKDTNIPISMQIRAMENGYPSKTILPFSDVTLNPEAVELSDNAAIPTTFTFQAPVYIKQSVEYCFVLLSDSNEYQVWISRMGDLEISGDRTISEQPYAGVLFKSQNASTWTADQYEDLKFTIKRATFNTAGGIAKFYNCELGVGNAGTHELVTNPLQTIKPKQVLTLEVGSNYNLSIGARIYQSVTNAQATVAAFNSTTDPDTVTITDIVGTWLAGSVDGNGDTVQGIVSSGSTATMYLSSYANGEFEVGQTVVGSSTGRTAEVVGWDNAPTPKVLTVRYVSGDFDTTNDSLDVQNSTIQGTFDTTATDNGITYAGDSRTAYPTAGPTFSVDERECTIFHQNHGMIDRSNNVEIVGIQSEIGPTILTSALAADASSISVEAAGTFHNVVNGVSISNSNPGYLKIEDEVIQYSSVSSDGKTITVATDGRGADATVAVAHGNASIVECYNFDGIPLIEINKTHTSISCPTLDTYMLHTTSVATNGIRGGGVFATATQNLPFEVLTPNMKTMVLPKTTIVARANTVSGTSMGTGRAADMDQQSFINDGSFQELVLNQENYYSSPRLICSKLNEENELSGAKSFNMEIILTSDMENVSPVIDLDRASLITTSNRINNMTAGLSTGTGYTMQYGTSGWSTLTDPSTAPKGDPNEAIYITRLTRLSTKATSLQVSFSSSRHPDTSFAIYFKALSVGSSTPLDESNWVNIGGQTNYNSTATEEELWKEYAYETKGLDFNAFQIKIVMKSTNQAKVPLISDFRAIALAK